MSQANTTQPDPTGSDEPGSDTTECPAIPGVEDPQFLGRGGMGTVFRVRYEGKSRVLKIVTPAQSADEQTRLALQARLMVEMKALERLRHPNVVRLVKRFLPPDYPLCYLMEDCPDGDLGRAIARHGRYTDVDKAAADFQMICAAVAYAHQQGVAHRDLKPGNILRAGDQWKLTDFGLARLMHNHQCLTQQGARFGTPGFSAPEQLAGVPGDGADAWRRADIYSLGGVLFFMLTGKRPEHPLGRLTPEEPTGPEWQAVDGRLRRICFKCLRHLPSQRYARVEELLEDVGRFRAGQPVAAQSVGLRDWMQDKWLRHRSYVFAIAAAATVALAIFIPLWRQSATDRDQAQRDADYARKVRILFARVADPALAADPDTRSQIEALPDGHDKLRLRLALLPRHMERNDRPQLHHELEDLTTHAGELSADDAKLLALWQADPSFNPRERWDQLHHLIKQVLERPGQLVGDEAAYARAVDRLGAGEVERALPELAALGVQHHRASRLRLRVQLEHGRYAEARRLAGEMRKRYPADPLPVLAEAMLDLLDGKVAKTRERIDLVCRDRGSQQQAALRRFWDNVVKGREALFQFLEPANFVQGAWEANTVADYMFRLKDERANAALEPALLELPLADRLVAAMETMLEASVKAPRVDQKVKAFQEANQRNPEGYLLLTAGWYKLTDAVEQAQKGNPDQAVAEIREARDLFRQGCTTPTLDRRTHYVCEQYEAITDIFLLRRLPEEVEDFEKLLGRLVEDGQPWPAERQRGLPDVVRVLYERVDPRLLTAWKLDDPKNREAYHRRQENLLNLGQTILIEKWRLSPPVDEQLIETLLRELREARRRLDAARP